MREESRVSMRSSWIKLIAVVVLASAIAEAQPQRFEVATIKPVGIAPPGGSLSTGSRDGGRFVSQGTSLQVLVQFAYGVQRYQIAGAPGWFFNEAFDIEARPETPFSPTPEQSKVMLRALLEERFGLRVRRESHEGTIYNMVVAKGGPKLRATATPPGQRTVRGGMGSFTGTGVRMESIRQLTEVRLERPVFDKTGLMGEYDVDLHWTQEVRANQPADDQPLPEGNESLITVLADQLGLKLESAKGTIPALVIQAVQRPGTN